MSDFRTQVQQAVVMAGSQQKLAEATGYTQQQISYLLKGATNISAEMAVAIERATEGKITRQELRPDLYAPPHERVA